MARDRANLRTDMISDDHYRALNRDEQWLYKLLLIHPSLSYAGVADWRPGRLASTAANTTAADVRAIGEGLQSKYFIYVDEDTEEVFIRSFVKHDGLLKQYRLPISMANDYAGISSRPIREFFIYELQKIHRKSPELKAWEFDRVKNLLERPAKNMKELSFGDELPLNFGHEQATENPGHADSCGEGYGIEYGNGYGTSPGKGYGMLTATATATATSTPNGVDNAGPVDKSPNDSDNTTGKAGTRLPPEFTVTPQMHRWALNHAPNVNTQTSTRKFKSYYRSVSGPAQFKTDWTAAWEAWLLGDQERAAQNLTASDKRLHQGLQLAQRAATRQPQNNPFEGREIEQ
ncbi:hypothetical protein [Glutamicibacter sp. V16R2B1]|uniref:hypothetical protein n=1 Tax=Glutamicibacter sp. V16R2B1 TaxID=2036207 RepID=UPI0010FF12CB|nr:hypothetical protein [Glutamicibacter sp. V16R2B1]TLK56290.1 hypothetical protein FDN03_02235 [Glutamicibacter sp. V16R2B1]